MRRTGLMMAGSVASLGIAASAQADTLPFGRHAAFRYDGVEPDVHGAEGRDVSGWQLSGAAKRVAEADPVDLGADDGADVLSLPAKTSAISPTMCVDFGYPTFRLLSKALSNGELKIEVTYPDVGRPVWEELKKFDGRQFTNAGSGWRVTDDIDMKVDLGGKQAGFRRVAFRFTALSGNWRLDDLYVDPRRPI
jgi:hypothetical protein